MKRIFSTLVCSGMLSACSLLPEKSPMPAQPHEAEAPLPATEVPLSWSDVLGMPAPAPGTRLSYGPDTQQFGYLRVPHGPGPHPVVVLIHGGCWLNAFDLEYFESWAALLADWGYATWNIEYRRLGDEGGGWPNTFLDVGQAIDYLATLADSHRLNLGDVRLAGHSAGGHLALWAATRSSLAKESELYANKPLAIKQVIGLAAISDLAEYRIGPANSCHGSVDPLMGGGPEEQPDRYAAASPAQRLPLGVSTALLHGDKDPIVAPEGAHLFVRNAQASGDPARIVVLPGAGHFDLGVPTPASTVALRNALANAGLAK